jgi:hypothetical protein
MRRARFRRRGAAVGLVGAAVLALLASQAGAAGSPRASTPVLAITFPPIAKDQSDVGLAVGSPTDIDFVVTDNESATDTIDLDISAGAVITVSEFTLTCGSPSATVALTQADPEDLEGTIAVTAASQTIACMVTPTASAPSTQARGTIDFLGSLESDASGAVYSASAQIPKPTPYDEAQYLLLDRPSAASSFYATTNAAGGGKPLQILWGRSTDVLLGGDIYGSGDDYPLLYRPSTATFYISQDGSLSSTGAVAIGSDAVAVAFGRVGDEPLVGNFVFDQNQGSFDTIGVYRPSNHTFYIDGASPAGLSFGQTGDIPLVGNWTGSSQGDSIGVYRPSNETFYLLDLDNDSTIATRFGESGDKPVVGDWNGKGATLIGIQRGNAYYLATSNTTGAASPGFTFGSTSDKATTAAFGYTTSDLRAIVAAPGDSARSVYLRSVRGALLVRHAEGRL